MDKQDKIGALRVVVDDFKDSDYRLGECDCATLVAAYCTELGIEHAWRTGDSELYHGSPKAMKRLIQELGKPIEAAPEIGDIVLLQTDGMNLAIVSGRGYVGMVDADGLVCFPPNVPVRRVWRIV